MPLIHGADISASEIEHAASTWDAVRFARLCNAIAWATAWSETQALPAFTERVIVADNGIDAHWQGELPPATSVSGPLLSAGTNVFQYKKREVTKQSRGQIVASLAADLRSAILDVERRAGIRLDTYALFTNVDLTPEQHERLRLAIADGLIEDRVRIRVIGAADLAAMLNGLPHLRSAFFATAAFRTWGESWDAHQRVIAFPQAALTGRDDALETLRAWIDDPEVRVIALSGTHMMGKTRLALEAARQRDTGFVEALDRQTLDINQLRPLEGPNRTILVLINDPDTEQAQRLVDETLARDGLKLIFCLATADATPAPSFGLDTRIRSLQLAALSEEQSRQLLRSVRTDLDFSLESWILDNADGVPGVVLAAAHVGPALRRDSGGFLDQVATGFAREVEARLSSDQQRALGTLSLMSHVGIEREAITEIETLCTHFGVDLNTVLNAVEPLKASGFVRVDGSYAEVVPPPLANRFAARMMRGRSAAVKRCFAQLSDA